MNTCTTTLLPARAFVALGSNLADPAGQVLAALDAIAALPGTRLLARSSLYLNAAVGYADQPDFINAVALLETTLTPQQLLDALLNIEHAFGRERTFRNAPRVIDLDVLSYAGTFAGNCTGYDDPRPAARRILSARRQRTWPHASCR
jgi:2-amino-4-hydroxy-6-hydroxymethyldihydropteridine diphosphokinase